VVRMSLEEFLKPEKEEEREEISDPVERKLREKLSGEELELALKLLHTPVSRIRGVIRELIEKYE